MEISNKIAVVTGVSGGIGLATVQALLEKGARVAGWGRRQPDLQHKNFHFIKTDVRHLEEVTAAFKATCAHFGGHVSILINNAGLGKPGLLEETDPEVWKEMFDTNVHGVFFCTKTVVPEMKKAEEGHIVNISSIAGNTGIEYMSGYCGTKFAVRGISQAIYKELRPFGIKVSCIYPGSVETNFFDDFPTVEANKNMMRPEDIATVICQCIETHPNFHVVDVEVRPLKPKG